MNRLQKKCFVGSAGVHLLLALILFVGPGFLSSPSKPDNLQVLDFVPAKTVDELVAPGGGDPKAKPPPAAPVQPPQPQPQAAPPPEPQPTPQKIREPDPVPETKPVAREEESFEPSKEKKPRKIEVSTKLITRKPEASDDRKARQEAEAKREAKALAEARRRWARQIGQAADYIGSDLSGGTSVELTPGPGGGGVSYANFLQALKSIYANAWVLPDGVEDNEATTVASVTIARNGTVLSYHITRFSGDSVVDHSVQTTLERVQHVPPLPENAKEDQRTVNINFNVKAKRLLG
jgi:TonB family protein